LGGPELELSFLEAPMPVVGFVLFGRCSAFSRVAAASGCAYRPPRSAAAKTIALAESGSERQPAGSPS